MNYEVESYYEKLVLNYRYTIKKTTYSISGVIRCKKYIVLIDKRTNLVSCITDYADYVLYRKTTDMSFEANNDAGLVAICQFLNYVLIDNYKKYRIKKIEDCTIQMFQDFLNWYAYSFTSQGKHPIKLSVVNKRDNISVFLIMLCHYKGDEMKEIKKEDLIETTYIKTGKYEKKAVMDYKVKIRYGSKIKSEKRLLRDMPIDIVERFIKMAQIYDPELVFAIVLMSYVGLREGEVCNVRRKESCYGPGLIMTYGDGFSSEKGLYRKCMYCDAIEIDLKDTLVMRSDGKMVGEIKRERIQPVYAGYVDIVFRYYQKHLEMIEHKSCEEYMPMFLSKYKDRKSGKYMAMTKSALCGRINRLFFKFVLPSLKNDRNPKLKRFYAQMQNHTWGAHAFRHWFTVSLVLLGCDEVVIQSARGDINRESSKTYLERKGELQNVYKTSVEVLGEQIRYDE